MLATGRTPLAQRSGESVVTGIEDSSRVSMRVEIGQWAVVADLGGRNAPAEVGHLRAPSMALRGPWVPRPTQQYLQ